MQTVGLSDSNRVECKLAEQFVYWRCREFQLLEMNFNNGSRAAPRDGGGAMPGRARPGGCVRVVELNTRLAA